MTFIGDYYWTQHARQKMLRYCVSESRVKRIIRFPFRTEEGIAPRTTAIMQPARVKKKDDKHYWTEELWVMYQVSKLKIKGMTENGLREIVDRGMHTIVIITVWRYPGQSPKRNPIPEEVLSEIQSFL